MRAMIFYLDEYYLLDVLKGNFALNYQLLSVATRATTLPEDAKIHHLFHCPERRAFGVVVESDSFVDVPPTERMPESPDYMAIERVSVRIDRDRGRLLSLLEEAGDKLGEGDGLHQRIRETLARG